MIVIPALSTCTCNSINFVYLRLPCSFHSRFVDLSRKQSGRLIWIEGKDQSGSTHLVWGNYISYAIINTLIYQLYPIQCLVCKHLNPFIVANGLTVWHRNICCIKQFCGNLDLPRFPSKTKYRVYRACTCGARRPTRTCRPVWCLI